MFASDELKQIENKFKETEKGKKIYPMKIASYVLFIISAVMVGIVVFSNGKTLTGCLTALVFFSYFITIIASVLAMIYNNLLQKYTLTDKKGKNKE